MKIAVISDTRLPTLPDGPHGLGRSAHDIASGLARRGHDVTLFAGAGSHFSPGLLVTAGNERAHADAIAAGDRGVFDAYLDTSHQHLLSQIRPGFPILNRMADRECNWQPPNTVVNSEYMRDKHPDARHVPTGVPVADIPFYGEPGGYLAYMSGRHRHKGYGVASRVADEAGRPYRQATDLLGAAKWAHMGQALALLHPSTIDAAPRLPLEAAATGTPTVCLSHDGCREHVVDGVTGFVCADETEMIQAVAACHVSGLSRKHIRRWVADTHGYEQMIDGYEALLQAVAQGETW